MDEVEEQDVPQGVVVSDVREDARPAPDQVWLEVEEGSPLLLADNLKQRGARLVGLTAYTNYDGEATVCYHYVVPTPNGESVFNSKFITRNRVLPSIAKLFPGAGWQEVAIGERYDVHFGGDIPLAGMLHA